MTDFEILSPAGNQESLVAGVRCGANAVYLGGKHFNARKNAGNFDFTDLADACAYCHARSVRVYLTMNTLVSDEEMNLALSCVDAAVKCGIDGIIVQDLGLASLIKGHYPSLRLHGSTQMSVTSPMGFKLLHDIGFVRVVLPRELNINEIKDIASSSKMEMEAFVHGALCMCLSGQCYMSAMIGSRSGNRGLCAQPCRLPFHVDEVGRSDLSLKDMSLIEHIKLMHKAGVSAFKIEGRMKRAEYVAAAVSACRQACENAISKETAHQLRSVFSRSGFTDGYLRGKLGSDMFGTRQKEDVVSAKDVLKDLAILYKDEKAVTQVSFSIKLKLNEEIHLTARASVFGKEVTFSAASQEVVEKAVNRAVTNEEIEKQLRKTGGTPFIVKGLSIERDNDIFVSASKLNTLRRDVLSGLEALLGSKAIDLQPKSFNLPHPGDRTQTVPVLIGRFDGVKQIPKNAHQLKKIILNIDETTAEFKNAINKYRNIYVELPRVIWSAAQERTVKKKLFELKAMGITHCVAPNLSAVVIGKEVGLKIMGDFSLNAFNSYSLEALSQLGIDEQTMSFEMTLDAIKNTSSTIKRGVIAYGRLPLMVTRNCPVKNEKTCVECGRSSSITDRKNISFPVLCRGGTAEIYNANPLYMADRLREIKNVDYMTLYFTTESDEECGKIIEDYKISASPVGEFTRGLYYRGVL